MWNATRSAPTLEQDPLLAGYFARRNSGRISYRCGQRSDGWDGGARSGSAWERSR